MIISDKDKFTLDFDPRSFEKNPDENIVRCDFEISFDHIVRSFSLVYNSFMVAERMHDVTEEEDFEDFYVALQDLNYPDLENLLPKYKSLFFPFMHEYFRIEFLEETLNAYPKDSTKYGFLLNSSKQMTLLENAIRVEGEGFLYPPSRYSNFRRLSYEESIAVLETLQ